VLHRYGNLWCTVYSNSMRPLMYRGDKVLVQNLDSSDLNAIRRGDIIVFKNGKSWVTHRIIGFRRIKTCVDYIEKGDANLDTTYLDRTSIIGIVRKIRSFQGAFDISQGRGKICQLLLTGVSLTSLHGWAVLSRLLMIKNNSHKWREYRQAFNKFITLIRIIIVNLFRKYQNTPDSVFPGGGEW
ncbi:signal peptidase I, partial [bacterium]|nr:signal peptidase I [bacterium]